LVNEILVSIVICITVLANCLAARAERTPQDEPPPPSGEYFLRTWVEYKSSSGKYKIKFPKTPREYSEVQGGNEGQSTVYIAEHKGLLLYVTSLLPHLTVLTFKRQA
jgi:hypothetical protein